MGKERGEEAEEGGGAESRIDERRSSHGTVSPLPASLPIFGLIPHAVCSCPNFQALVFCTIAGTPI